MTKKIAIVGFSFRLPGSTPNNFWQALCDGANLVSQVEGSRWSQEHFLHPSKSNPGTSYTFAAGSIGDVSGFDAGFFGISPREVEQMDPQQRLLLELAWEAFENGAIKPSSMRQSKCGVYVGISSTDYAYRRTDDMASLDASSMTGSTASIAANRISYLFDLRGPSMIIDTACSSSLVAFHQACQAIQLGETDQALVGGVSLHLHPFPFIGFSKASMLSKRGICNVFDAAGDGYVRSEGAGIFILKDLDKALADGNRILAVVASSGVNCDGKTNGLTVPSADAQARLLEEVYAKAGIQPDDVDYLEAHGTGTSVGDPIETRAIGNALGRRRSTPLPIGSVKSNVGHLEAASGVAGLVKALLSIEHRMVPPTIHLNTPNPKIKFDEWNIAPVTRNTPLKQEGRLTVGINSFGFGGANAHVVLQSPPAPGVKTPEAVPASSAPLFLSAKSQAALQETALAYANHLQNHPEQELYDLAYSAAHHRDQLDHRLCAFAGQREELVQDLLAFAETGKAPRIAAAQGMDKAGGPVFVYSGNGSQWAGMGKALLAEDEIFRNAVAEVDACFAKLGDFSIRAELEGENGNRLEFTEIAQPTLFAIQVGLTRMFLARGIQPKAVMGHSVGEVAAAWASGALSLEQAVQVVFHRSAEQGKTKGFGQMTAAGISSATGSELIAQLGLAEQVCIAGINSPKGITLAGTPEGLSCLEAQLKAQNAFHKRLDLDYAFHSPAMDGIQAGIETALASLAPGATATSFISTVTGSILEGSALDAAYWWHNIRKPVLFADALGAALAEGHNVFVEIGPHPVLRNYVAECLKEDGQEGRVVPTMSRTWADATAILTALHQTLLTGVESDRKALFPVPGRAVRLPNYTWQRDSYWHPVTPESYGFLHRQKVHPLLGYALSENPWQWENQMDLALYPVYKDHAVGEAIVFPAAGFIEMAMAACRLWQPGTPADLEDMEIHAPLLLDENHGKTVRFILDPVDGSFQIKSRDRLSDEPWLVNVVGRLLGGKPASRTLPVFDRSGFHPDISGALHYQRAHHVGLAYGPAFQAVSRIQLQDATALAEFTTPAAIEPELGAALLHPSFLDGCFQLLVNLLGEDSSERNAYIPIRMGRITLFQENLPVSHASVTITKRSPRSVVADCLLYAADGSLLAEVRQARFRQMLLNKAPVDHLKRLAFSAISQPLPLDQQQTCLSCFDVLQDQLRQKLAATRHELNLDTYYDEVEPLLDVLSSSYALEALRRLTGAEDRFNAAELLTQGIVAPEQEALLEALLQMLEEDQHIIPAGTEQSYAWNLDDDIPPASDTWLTLLEDYPDYANRIIALNRIGSHLEGILRGTVRAETLLPGLQAPGALGWYAEETGRRLEKAVTRLVFKLTQDSGRRLRVLELDLRTSRLAPALLPRLDLNRCDYVLAVPADGLRDQPEELQERYPAMEICQWSEQGIALQDPRPFDLILLPDGFTDLPNREQLLAQLHAMTAGSGYLISLEQRPSRWTQILLADMEPARQPRHDWQATLLQCGYTQVTALEDNPEQHAGPVLYLAQTAPRESVWPAAGQGAWVLVCDGAEGSAAETLSLDQALEAQLENLGLHTVRLSPGAAHPNGYRFDAGQPESLAQTLAAIQETHGGIAGMVLLAGLDEAPNTPETRLARQENRSHLAILLLQAGEALGLTSPLLLISHNAQGALLDAPVHADDASLWGLGRTMINETTGPKVRLIDLCQPVEIDQSTLSELAPALAREILAPDGEDEAILTPAGRHVPRLRPVQASASAEESGSIARLDFNMPGQLKNLLWRTGQLPDIAEGQVEIEVQAAGLNFRDVMYAMGLLSDEAVENGFAGATLGMELSGIVRAIGPGVTRFAPGDEVIAFAPAAFSTRVLTPASAVVSKPAGWSFEAAATIPTTFFTVYYALHHLARLQPGEKILIHGAAGGVGIAAIRLARHMGAEVFATAGSDEKRQFVRLLGADHVLDSRSLAYADEIMEITGGRGIDVVLNSLAGEAINRNLRILRPFGRFLELGKRDFYENTQIGLRPFRNNITYFGIDADQLMSECPELTERLFHELMALFTNGDLQPLPYRVFPASEIVEAFRYMQQSRQIGKIVVSFRAGTPATQKLKAPAATPLTLPADASYLVTGGLSGFGLVTARWLAEKGARHLVLASRRGPVTEEAQAGIAALEALGVQVKAVSCDITDRAALTALLDDIKATLPPLRGIVHAAMVIDDGLLRNMDKASLQRVYAPKILGAYHLDELSRSLPLDFFLVYSSATTLFGNPGQGNYVAANNFLEALMASRRQQGLPGLAVCWGAIDDVGFLARNEQVKEALQSRMGGTALRSAVALEVLEQLLQHSPESAVGVLDLDWSALNRFLPSAQAPKFREMAHGSDAGGDEGDSAELQRWLRELPPEELHGALANLLKEEVGEILRIPPEKIDENKSVFDMGMDSLMGVELVTAVDQRFGVNLPVMALSEGPTIAKLTERIIGQLKAGDAAQAQETPAVAQQVAQVLAQHGQEADGDLVQQVADSLTNSR